MTPKPEEERKDEMVLEVNNRNPLGTGGQAGVILFCLLFALASLAVLFLILRRRSHPILKIRSPATLCVVNLYALIFCIIITFSFVQGKTRLACDLNDFVGMLFCSLFIFPYVYMFVLVVYADKLNSLKVSRAAGVRDWRWKLRFLFLDSFRIPLIACVSAAVYPIFLAFRYVPIPLPGGEDGTSPPGEEINCYRRGLLLAISISFGLYLIVCYFVLRSLFVHDPYFIRFESHLAALVQGPLALTALVYASAPQIFPSWFDVRVIVLVSMTDLLLTCSYLPLFLTYHPFRKRFLGLSENIGLKSWASGGVTLRTESPQTTVNSIELSRFQLSNVLNDSQLYESFKKFCINTWTIENLLFIEAAHDYMQAEEKDLKSKAKNILDEYIREGAPLEVNVDYPTRAKTIEAFMEGNVTRDLFDEAVKEITRILEKDTMRKWWTQPTQNPI